MMTVRIIILRDIPVKGFRDPFWKKATHIDYDSKSPIKDKYHTIVYQQGSHYGTVGDRAWDLSHEQLLDLEREGYIVIKGKIKR